MTSSAAATTTTTVDYTFEWPAGPEDVVVTGEFDEWKGTMPLLKTSSGDFELTFPVKIPSGKEKVFFKFIVDGNWVTSDAYSKGCDENGIENNYISRSEAQALSENPIGTKIPEAGGLVFGATSSTVDEDVIPEPGAYPRNLVDRKSEEVSSVSRTGDAENSVSGSEPSAPVASATTSAPKPEPAAVPKPVEATGTKEAKVTGKPISSESAHPAEPVKTTEAESSNATEAPSKAEPAAMPIVAVETIEPEESKVSPVSSPALSKNAAPATITTPPETAASTAVPDVVGSTAAIKDTSLETVPTGSSSDSKKRFRIKRRFKKNKATGEKTIISEERVPLDSEESGNEQPLVDEELVASPVDTAADDVHIMPIEDPTQGKSTEFKPLAGEPGLVVPGNVAEVKEFSEVRDVDVDELNERLNKKEKEKDAAAKDSETNTHTLDPKTHQSELKSQTSNKLYEVANGDGDALKEEQIAPDSEAVPASAPAKESDTSAPEKPVKAEKKPVAQKTSAAAPKQEEKKKKGGFFSKLKKILH